jgi:hypothetical protein
MMHCLQAENTTAKANMHPIHATIRPRSLCIQNYHSSGAKMAGSLEGVPMTRMMARMVMRIVRMMRKRTTRMRKRTTRMRTTKTVRATTTTAGTTTTITLMMATKAV